MWGERWLLLLLLGSMRVPGRPAMQQRPCCWYRPVMEAAPTGRLLLLVAGGKLLRLLLQVGGVLLG